MKTENKNIIEDDFFDYLSEKNMPQINDKDVNDLFQRIDKKTLGKSINKSSNGFYIMLIGSFTLILLFCLFNKRTIIQIAPQAIEEEKLSLKNSLDTIPVTNINQVIEENYIIPGKGKVRINDNTASTTASDEITKEDIVIDPLDSKSISLSDSSKNIEQNEVDLKLIPNSSVYYIYDLKITEYQKLYFKKLKPFALNVDNISAQFENTDSYLNFIKEKGDDAPYTLDMLLKDALKAFNKKKYNQSALLFNDLLNYNTHDPNAYFYGGLCAFNEAKYQNAITKFDKVLELENNTFHQEAKWYKALALLKSNNRNEAMKIFLNIVSEKGFYATRAEEKLIELSIK